MSGEVPVRGCSCMRGRVVIGDPDKATGVAMQHNGGDGVAFHGVLPILIGVLFRLRRSLSRPWHGTKVEESAKSLFGYRGSRLACVRSRNGVSQMRATDKNISPPSL